MPNAIALRPDYTASALRGLARRSKDAAQARRLLALAVICDRGTRSEAARLGNVTLQIVRDWVVRFNAEGPDGLRDRKSAGPTPRLNEAHRAALMEIVERGPMPAIHGVVRWRLGGAYAFGQVRGRQLPARRGDDDDDAAGQGRTIGADPG